MKLNAALNDGRTLQEAADDHPVLLLFLRHFGCIFCRAAVAELARLQEPIGARGVEVVIVHMGLEDEASEFFHLHGGEDFSRISDPQRRLYNAFDLRHGTFRQLMGLKIWTRAFELTRAGIHQGRTAGDVFQMPGCFLLHKGQILAAYPYDRASDSPDYLEFIDAALSGDDSQLALLRPDGSYRPLSPRFGATRTNATPYTGRARLLLVGGNGSIPQRFARARAHLQHRWEVEVVEIAGQGGRRDAPIPDSLEGFARDLAAQLEHAAREAHPRDASGQDASGQDASGQDASGQGASGRRPLHIYGHGIGGLILAHALRYTDLEPDGLILHAPVGAWLTRRRFPQLMRSRLIASTARALLGAPATGIRLFRRMLEPAARLDNAELEAFALGYRQAASFEALFTAVDPITALDGLNELRCPTVLLWGGRDRVLGVGQLAAWAEALPNAPVRAHLEPDWRHYPYLDAPLKFATVLEELLLQAPPAMIARLEQARDWPPRSKAGRMIAMRRAGLPTPDGWYLPAEATDYSLARAIDSLPGSGPWSVRSSAALEDQAQTTGAGLFRTELEVTREGLRDAIARVRASGPGGHADRPGHDGVEGPSGRPAHAGGPGYDGVEGPSGRPTHAGRPGYCDVLIQPMIPRTAGGVAWVRAIGADLEIAPGGAEGVVEGREGLTRAYLSELGEPWRHIPAKLPGQLTAAALEERLWPLLKQVRALFAVPALDVEWCYDPNYGFTILQARPLVEGLEPRRMLSAANIQEIVPSAPSMMLLESANAASARLPRYYARLDRRLADLDEPFTREVSGRYYLNADLFAAIFHCWGLPTGLVSRQIGGALPARGVDPGRFLASLPVFGRILSDQARVGRESQRALDALERSLPDVGEAAALADWFEAAYLAVVTGNFRITGIVTLPFWPFGPPPVTAGWAEDVRRLGAAAPEVLEKWGHRGVYESDPSWPRGDHPAIRTTPRPRLPDPLEGLPALLRRLPWLFPRYMRAHREWFRDSAMRLWAAWRSRLMETARLAAEAGHLEEAGSIWSLGPEALRLPPAQWKHALGGVRRASPELPPPLFWSDTLTAVSDTVPEAVILRAGTVTGKAVVARTPQQALTAMKRLTGPIILIAPAVDPGWMAVFLNVAGIATELGGRLSHAATLIQEQMDIPAVFNLKSITTQFRTGDDVRLEIPPGRVVKLEP